ncbi:MAG: class II fructose-bisphosphatase, partial [Nitriliruptoraceae bacterium]
MNSEKPDRNLAIEMVRVTEAAAMSSARWQGRGDKEAGDRAAVDAMRQMLDTVEMDATVVIGEGEKDEAPMLFNGERVGTGRPPRVDLAVDPVEGTRLLAEGRPGALAVIAAAPADTLFDPGPCVYMEKIVVGADAAEVIDLDHSLTQNLEAIAEATHREVRDLTVVMLDRDRHEEAKRQVRDVGARLTLITDGDVAGGLLAAWDERPQVDVLYGIGGTPEGVITACAVKALGGRMLGRLWPRTDDERAAAVDAGYDVDRVLDLDDLVAADDCSFACTGITSSQLLDGAHFDRYGATTDSLVMRSKSGTVRQIRAR